MSIIAKARLPKAGQVFRFRRPSGKGLVGKGWGAGRTGGGPPKNRAGCKPNQARRSHRTIWISDVHLGTRGCRADLLLDFLTHNECETLYLVGDIVDGWRLKQSFYWPDAHNQVVKHILRLARNGTRVIYIPGNHDDLLRGYTDINLGGVDLQSDLIHETADGRRLWVVHGDQFDGIVKYAKWLTAFGDWAYNLALWLNEALNTGRRFMGLDYWSLAAWLKYKAKAAVEYIAKYENAVIQAAAKRGVDGVVCGHIHHAEIRQMGDVLYCNDGDWVESCTALVEDAAGNLEILRWMAFAPERQAPSQAHSPAAIA